MAQLKTKIGGWKIIINKEVNLLIKHSNVAKSKAVPLQAWSGPEGSRKLR
jgi:hypothetical protein